MTSKITYLELIEACKEPGCPVCQVTQKAVEHYLNILFYEQVNDGLVRHDLRTSLGFCHEHAWLAVNSEVGDALGLAMIYNDVFNTILRALPNEDDVQSPLKKISGLFMHIPHELAEKLESIQHILTPQGQCLACKQRNQTTENTLSVLIESLQDEAMVSALESSDGLCLPHLRQAFTLVKNAPDYTRLLSLTRQKLTDLTGELAEFIRKNDYRFSPEGYGREGDSWKRAVAKAVGNKKQRMNSG